MLLYLEFMKPFTNGQVETIILCRYLQKTLFIIGTQVKKLIKFTKNLEILGISMF